MKKKYIFIISGSLIAVSVAVGLCCGAEFINPFAVIKNIVNGDQGLKMEILLKIRFPRVMAAVFTGAALSVSGAVFQSVFRNPLADPFITGVSGGASLGISAAVIFSLGTVSVMFFSFAGSILAIAVLYLLSYARGFGGGVFILAGVAMSFIFSSSVMLLFSIAESRSVHKAIIWMMGDLSSSGDAGQGLVSALIFIIALLLWFYHRHINIISLGRSFSNSSGVSDTELRIILVLASLLASLSVVLGGIIPFVGLMMPHLVRIINGHDNRHLIPLSALWGASFLVLSDALSRSLVFPYEIPVGVITGFAGGVFFLFFVIRNRQVY